MKKLRRNDSNYQLLRAEKLNHRELRRHPEMFKRKQNEILKAFMEAKVPEWGGIQLLISKVN